MADQSATDWPKGVGKPAQRALDSAGFSRLEDLTAVAEAEVGQLHGIGAKALGLLREALHAQGLSFST